jgi:hypothetical protein
MAHEENTPGVELRLLMGEAGDQNVASLKETLNKVMETPGYEEILAERIFEHKTSDEISLTPEQLQAQQDFYDQWTAPTTEPVDFEVEKEAYLARRQITAIEHDHVMAVYESPSSGVSYPNDTTLS